MSSGPELIDLLQQAIDRHRRGDLDGADLLYVEALRRDPAHVEALQLRGALLRRQGRLDEAIGSLERAVATDPEHAVAWTNLGLAQLDQGQIDAAEASLARATAVAPGRPEAWMALGRLRLRRGANRGAAQAAAGALRAKPGHPEARLLLGLARAAMGREARQAGALDEALRLLSPIDEGDPAAAALRYELGHALLALGREDEAEATWREARARPDCPPELATALGGLLLRQGRPAEAALALLPALRPGDGPSAAWLAFTDALGQQGAPDPALGPAIAAALAIDGLDHQRLERAARGLLAADPAIGAALAALDEHPDADAGTALDALAAHPLTAPWLSRTLIAHPAGERLWTALRARLLADGVAGQPAPAHLTRAVAEQAWNTEYAAAPSPAEQQILDALAAAPEALDAARLGLWAMYRPLADLPVDPARLRALAPELAARQLDETAEERALGASLPAIGPGGDAVSTLVRAQYEDNPYPRLVSFQRRAPLPLALLLRAQLPGLGELPSLPSPLRVLVAGCGTGQHALTAATRTADASVTAIDLSRASLGRAARLALRHGVQNLRFVAADLLDARHLGQTFDLVESVGVLHHLARPADGLAALVEVTAPGGLLLLGLYSERGRQDVVAARALIAERGWAPTPDGLRAARDAIARLPADHPARPVLYSPDFASLSGTRDLLFHVAEQRFTPLGLAALIQGAGLEFLGFQHSRPEPPALYRARWPQDAAAQDLGRWDELEAQHPRLFSGMYVFWCRKPTGPAPTE